MGDAAETTSKTLHNWMAEPRPRPSGQGDDEETLQLSLGLPGGGGGNGAGAGLPPAAAWRMLPARDKEMHSAAAAVDTSSMLSLGYSAPAFSPARSPGKHAYHLRITVLYQIKKWYLQCWIVTLLGACILHASQILFFICLHSELLLE
jgi:hypothetical protein